MTPATPERFPVMQAHAGIGLGRGNGSRPLGAYRHVLCAAEELGRRGRGCQHLSRIGQEVLVSFLENDIDRPVVTGVLYNGTHRPPDFSTAGRLPANKTLSGHKSKEYKGSRYNELLFDDSANEIRTKLSSEHGKTQLNQGFLFHPRSEGKSEPRGEGMTNALGEADILKKDLPENLKIEFGKKA